MATALITGGTSGIGAAFARAFARRGDILILVARDESRLAAMAGELRSAGAAGVETMSADLADRADVERVAARLADPAHPVDILVNNAGFGVHSPLVVADTSVHEHAMDVMCRAVLVLAAAAAGAMRERGSGTILNVSSVAGLLAMGSYSAIKAWVTAYSEGLAVELRGTGVRVTALCPGWVRTEFHQRAGIRTSSIPKSLWIEADELVEACLRDVEREKVISIPTVRYRVLVWFIRHAPRGAIRSVSAAISSARKGATAS